MAPDVDAEDAVVSLERINLRLPVGSGPDVATAATQLAYSFAQQFIDRSRGVRHAVIYADMWPGYDCAAWWTTAGGVTVEAWARNTRSARTTKR